MSLAEGFFVKIKETCGYQPILWYCENTNISTQALCFLVFCVLTAGCNSLLILSFSIETAWKQSFIFLKQRCLFRIGALWYVVKDINNAYPLTSSREAHHCVSSYLLKYFMCTWRDKKVYPLRSWLNHITPSQGIFSSQHSDVAQ